MSSCLQDTYDKLMKTKIFWQIIVMQVELVDRKKFPQIASRAFSEVFNRQKFLNRKVAVK